MDDTHDDDAPAGAHPLEALARESAGVDPTDLGADEAAHGPAQAEPTIDLSAIEGGASRIIFGMLCAVRARIAVKLPEIRDEWTDEILQGPAAAAIPLLRKYAMRLLQTMGENAELAAFAMSLIPLVMGLMAAQDKHKRTIDTTATEVAPE